MSRNLGLHAHHGNSFIEIIVTLLFAAAQRQNKKNSRNILVIIKMRKRHLNNFNFGFNLHISLNNFIKNKIKHHLIWWKEILMYFVSHKYVLCKNAQQFLSYWEHWALPPPPHPTPPTATQIITQTTGKEF